VNILPSLHLTLFEATTGSRLKHCGLVTQSKELLSKPRDLNNLFHYCPNSQFDRWELKISAS
ncbi:hypothetical protein, partial [Roseimarinus sediminis]|uniref:hypothetical protein n=1 Tax=Roseimarinus sediminis TaxID=1610899 RepID=UPI003D1C5C34